MRARAYIWKPSFPVEVRFDALWAMGDPSRYPEMVAAVTEGANPGRSGDMERLGRAYLHGRGVEKDLAEASRWLKKAAEAGNKYAQKLLANDALFE